MFLRIKWRCKFHWDYNSLCLISNHKRVMKLKNKTMHWEWLFHPYFIAFIFWNWFFLKNIRKKKVSRIRFKIKEKKVLVIIKNMWMDTCSCLENNVIKVSNKNNQEHLTLNACGSQCPHIWKRTPDTNTFTHLFESLAPQLYLFFCLEKLAVFWGQLKIESTSTNIILEDT